METTICTALIMCMNIHLERENQKLLERNSPDKKLSGSDQLLLRELFISFYTISLIIKGSYTLRQSFNLSINQSIYKCVILMYVLIKAKPYDASINLHEID